MARRHTCTSGLVGPGPGAAPTLGKGLGGGCGVDQLTGHFELVLVADLGRVEGQERGGEVDIDTQQHALDHVPARSYWLGGAVQGVVEVGVGQQAGGGTQRIGQEGAVGEQAQAAGIKLAA